MEINKSETSSNSNENHSSSTMLPIGHRITAKVTRFQKSNYQLQGRSNHSYSNSTVLHTNESKNMNYDDGAQHSYRKK